VTSAIETTTSHPVLHKGVKGVENERNYSRAEPGDTSLTTTTPPQKIASAVFKIVDT
jgi:hypothetical protein